MNKGGFHMIKKLLLFIFILFIFKQFYQASNYIIKTDINSRYTEINNQNIITQKYINVPLICQYPQLPTGCESVAATMVLQYYDVQVQPEEFVSEWLNYSENFYYNNGILYGPNPDQVFAGNPFSNNSYGCYSDVIVKAVNNHSTTCHAQAIFGQSLKTLCERFINNGQPILIWATMGMKESKEGNSWTLENGKKYTWIAGEHCLVLVGYDQNDYYLNDPQTGTTVSYEKSLVEKRYQELGSQAVFIYPH